MPRAFLCKCTCTNQAKSLVNSNFTLVSFLAEGMRLLQTAQSRRYAYENIKRSSFTSRHFVCCSCFHVVFTFDPSVSSLSNSQQALYSSLVGLGTSIQICLSQHIFAYVDKLSQTRRESICSILECTSFQGTRDVTIPVFLEPDPEPDLLICHKLVKIRIRIIRIRIC